MANQPSLGLEEMMLDGMVKQPPIDLGPFVVCKNSSKKLPDYYITFFYDGDEWGRLVYRVTNSGLVCETKLGEDTYFSPDDWESAKKILQEEAKKLDAMVLFSRTQFPELIWEEQTYSILGKNTFIFMMNYFDYVLNELTKKEVHGGNKNEGS